MKKTFLSLLISLFILSLTCFSFAQPMEEEEEPVQTRPSPIMNQKMNTKASQTKKGAVMQQQKLSNKAKTNIKQFKGQIQTPAQQQKLNNAK